MSTAFESQACRVETLHSVLAASRNQEKTHVGMSPSLAAGVVRVYLHTHPTDMRRSYDGLCALIESAFQRDVRCGDLFLFLNRRLDRVNLMYWDRDGIAI